MAETYSLKYFNGEVFQRYVNEVPDLRLNRILNSGIFEARPDLKARLAEGVGGNLLVEPMYAPLEGEADNYDGTQNITDSESKTYIQSKIVFGRAHAWKEKDFAYDITGGVDFRATATKVAKWFDNVNEDALLAILKGVFSMVDENGGTDFVTSHTTDLSGLSTASDKKVKATTLNSAIQKACGDHKGEFAVVLMHSQTATNLENLQAISYFTYNDANGIQRDINLYSWNGKLVIVDDSCPVDDTKYTTYVIGLGAFEYCDCGAKVPFEADRDTHLNGGTDYILARERKLFAPKGISWKGASTIVSPTDTQLGTGTNWELAKCSNGTGSYPAKAIALARIISVE